MTWHIPFPVTEGLQPRIFVKKKKKKILRITGDSLVDMLEMSKDECCLGQPGPALDCVRENCVHVLGGWGQVSYTLPGSR